MVEQNKNGQELPEDLFAQICYLALMQSGDGLISKHPTYVEEKKYVLEMGWGAFAALDMYNQRTVISWLKNWGFEIPEVVEEVHTAEVAAWNDLVAKLGERL